MLTKTYITVVLNNYITPKDPHMTLEIIDGIFSVCKLEKTSVHSAGHKFYIFRADGFRNLARLPD